MGGENSTTYVVLGGSTLSLPGDESLSKPEYCLNTPPSTHASRLSREGDLQYMV
jgi:hypothetical protein